MSPRKLILLGGCVLILAASLFPGWNTAVTAAPTSPAAVTTWLGAEVKVSQTQTPTDADRYLPAAAYSSQHHQYLVVWHNQWSGSRDIYAQRMGSNGRLVGTQFSVSSGANDRMAPAVAYNATDDEYLVVYMFDASGDRTRWDIMAQRLTWSGVKIGSAFQIETSTTRTLYSPRVIWKAAYNEYLIVWGTRDTATGLPAEVAEKLIDSVGGVRYATILASTNQPCDPDLVWDATFDRYLIVWTYKNAANHTAIMGDLRDGNANRVGGITNPFVIFSSDTNDALSPRVSSNSILFLAVFEYAYSPSDHDIKGAWVNNNASLVIPIDLSTSGANEAQPALANSFTRHEIMLIFQRTPAGHLSEAWLRPISNTIPAAEISVCDYIAWDCVNPTAVWGPPGYLLLYSSQNTGNFVLRRHIYSRLFATNATFIPAVRH